MGIELWSLVKEQKSELAGVAKGLVERKGEKVAAGLGAIALGMATGHPELTLLSPFLEEGVRRAFGSNATERLQRAVAEDEARTKVRADEEAIAARIVELIEEALIQMVRVQHATKDEVLDALGGLHEELADFRRDFQSRLEDGISVLARLESAAREPCSTLAQLAALPRGTPPSALAERARQMFGREPNIQAIMGRLCYPGLTAIVARARMGKSWLLNEVARRLIDVRNSEFIVGYFSNSGDSDPLLCAIQDLYARWLSAEPDATRCSVADKLSGFQRCSEPYWKLSGFGESGPLRPAELRRLLGTASDFSGRRIVLFVDGWDKTLVPDKTQELVETFLRNMGEWPACHFVLALRDSGTVGPDRTTLERMETLVAAHTPYATLHRLRELEFDDSESARLIEYLHDALPVTHSVNPKELVRMIGGYPGVIGSWLAPVNADRLTDQAKLEAAAQAAHEGRYPDLLNCSSTCRSNRLSSPPA